MIPGILGVSELPDGKQILDGIVAYLWQVDTKYYTADVCLCISQDRTIGDKVFAESVQAVVIHFDTQQVREQLLQPHLAIVLFKMQCLKDFN